jgi:hypothetical protein
MNSRPALPLLLILALMPAGLAQAGSGAAAARVAGGLVDDSGEWLRVAFECRDLLLQRRFAELEARGQDWNRTQARSPSGSWLLESYFHYLAPIDTRVDETVWQNYAQLHAGWRTSLAAPSAVQLVAEAMFWSAYARTTGGTARAVPPPPEKLALANEYWSRAESTLRDNWALAATVPTAYTALAGMFRLRGWTREQCETLYAEGLRRYPSYHPLHLAHGTLLRLHDATREIAPWAWNVTAGQPEAHRHEIYARVAWSHAGTGPTALADGGYDWAKVRAGFEVLRERWPQSGHIVNRYARFAWQAGDRETARRLLPLIGDRPILVTWRNRETFESFRQWAGGALGAP